MPIAHAIWTVDERPAALPLVQLVSEEQLEDMIVAEPRIISSEWLLIGRQETTTFGGRIDLLAIAPDGSLVLLELKRNRTPREIVAQALDYAAWVEELEADRIAQIYERFSRGGNLDEAFRRRFNTDLDEETLNESHQIIIVAAELDNASERIVRYLNDRDIAINLVSFQVFQHGDQKLFSRAWLIDPGTTQVNAATTSKGSSDRQPWNGEYYVSFGGDCTWEDARRFGFISAGGGTWYTQTLRLLSPGDLIWVKIPKKGYVGVGRVSDTVKVIHEFEVPTDAGPRPALEALSTGDSLRSRALDADLAEHFVPVDWIDTVPESQAFDEVGLFGNQNTVCQPTTPKWRHTVERLKARFKQWNRSLVSAPGPRGGRS